MQTPRIPRNPSRRVSNSPPHPVSLSASTPQGDGRFRSRPAEYAQLLTKTRVRIPSSTITPAAASSKKLERRKSRATPRKGKAAVWLPTRYARESSGPCGLLRPAAKRPRHRPGPKKSSLQRLRRFAGAGRSGGLNPAGRSRRGQSDVHARFKSSRPRTLPCSARVRHTGWARWQIESPVRRRHRWSVFDLSARNEKRFSAWGHAKRHIGPASPTAPRIFPRKRRIAITRCASTPRCLFDNRLRLGLYKYFKRVRSGGDPSPAPKSPAGRPLSHAGRNVRRRFCIRRWPLRRRRAPTLYGWISKAAACAKASKTSEAQWDRDAAGRRPFEIEAHPQRDQYLPAWRVRAAVQFPRFIQGPPRTSPGFRSARPTSPLAHAASSMETWGRGRCPGGSPQGFRKAAGGVNQY